MGESAASEVLGDDVKRLIGTWVLVSASSITSSAQRDEAPYGAGAQGFLTYTANGRVSALISYGGRKPLSIAATAQEQAEAFKTFFAYAGAYVLKQDRVIHRIEVSSIQNYVGRELIRTVKFEGDRITLTTPPSPVNGKIQTVELIWERLSGTE